MVDLSKYFINTCLLLFCHVFVIVWVLMLIPVWEEWDLVVGKSGRIVGEEERSPVTDSLQTVHALIDFKMSLME